MARYIDAEELCRRLNECWETNDIDKGRLIQQVIDRVITPIVVGTPTANVEEVVRCKDCKQFIEYAEGIQCVEKANGDCYIRMMYSLYKPFCSVTYDDFYSYGKRRDS